jgi:hypothetical protein
VKKRGRPKDPKSAAGQKRARKVTQAQQDQQQQPEQLDAGGSADPANAINPAADLDEELPAIRKRRKPDLIPVEEVRKAWLVQAPPRPDAKGRDVKQVWCRACTKLSGKDIVFTEESSVMTLTLSRGTSASFASPQMGNSSTSLLVLTLEMSSDFSRWNTEGSSVRSTFSSH